MCVLVIGGTGLISTAIVNRLIAKGHSTILFNRGQSAARYEGDVETVHGDRQDFDAFHKAIGALDVDAVIDMITFDARTAEHGVEVFAGRVQQYLFCSTVCVYGGPLTCVPAVEDEPQRPVSDYGRNKSEAEQVFMQAHRTKGFPVTMFRPSHCYGPGQPLLDIFGYNPALTTRIREGRPVVVPGDGTGLWQPGFVDDMAKGFVGALGRDETVGQAYNIVGDEVMDWQTFHRIMGTVLGRETNVAFLTTQQILAGTPPGEGAMLEEIFQYHAAYSNEKLKSHVPEFTDLLSFEEGVRRTVEWMDAVGAHAPEGSQLWIDAMVDMESAFRDELAAGR